MKNKTVSNQNRKVANLSVNVFTDFENSVHPSITAVKVKQKPVSSQTDDPAEILFITSYPPRECGIATYSHDLIKALDNKFSNSLYNKSLCSGIRRYELSIS
jgi:hypothetical protein